MGYVNSHPDAPVWIRFSFAENLKEFEENVGNYQGWICSAWVQQEQLHFDLIPGEYTLPRRYSFRYVKIDILISVQNLIWLLKMSWQSHYLLQMIVS